LGWQIGAPDAMSRGRLTTNLEGAPVRRAPSCRLRIGAKDAEVNATLY
jgi:hypothetical protein